MVRSPKKQTFLQKNHTLLLRMSVGVAVVVVAFLALYAYNRTTSTSTTSSTDQVTKLVMATSVDAAAKAQHVTSTFSLNDKHIYMVASLHNVKSSDKITYARYYNGTYVDSAEAKPSTDTSSHFFFDWSKNQQGSYPKGTYLIKVYINGTLEDAVAYSVQ
jgi:hypothetical protein